MTRLRGRAPRNQRIHDRAPAGHWCTTTMISSIRIDSSTACMIVDGATDTDVFEAFAESVLVPTLKPGDMVVTDNLSPPQGTPDDPTDRTNRGASAVPASLLPRFEPHRENVEQGQGVPAVGQSPNRSRPLGGHRRRPGSRHVPRCDRLVCLMRLYYLIFSSFQIAGLGEEIHAVLTRHVNIQRLANNPIPVSEDLLLEISSCLAEG
jgi:hypothetical protein